MFRRDEVREQTPIGDLDEVWLKRLIKAFRLMNAEERAETENVTVKKTKKQAQKGLDRRKRRNRFAREQITYHSKSLKYPNVALLPDVTRQAGLKTILILKSNLRTMKKANLCDGSSLKNRRIKNKTIRVFPLQIDYSELV